MTWDGRSCNGRLVEGSGVGVIFIWRNRIFGNRGGHPSSLLVQLGNIALRSGQTLNINPGHIIKNNEAMKYWSREYEPDWEPKI